MTAPVAFGVLGELLSVLPNDAVVTDPNSTAAYRSDEARLCDGGLPLIVVRPENRQHIEAVMRVASRSGVPVVPQGARTGLSGGANAVDGCIILSMTRMNRIIAIDPIEQLAVVEPGVINSALSEAVAEQGLFYPPDPSSWMQSTIGGNVATNAGGLCCVKYGVTADYVRALEVVMADGQVLRTGHQTAKGVAGYDLTRLMVGSEGTLGVISQITLRLVPAPEASLTVAAAFGSVEDAARACTQMARSGLRPSLLELLDGVTIRAIQAYRNMGLAEHLEALLLVQSDRGSRAPEDVARIAQICRDAGAEEVAEASDAGEASALLEARRLVNVALDQLGATVIEDVAVPRARLGELLSGVALIAAKRQITIACPGHAGDGNMHPTVIFDPSDPDALFRAERAFSDVMALGLELGGTISGEHGIGLLKRDWLVKELGPLSTRLQRELKSVFDPGGIMNPSKMFL